MGVYLKIRTPGVGLTEKEKFIRKIDFLKFWIEFFDIRDTSYELWNGSISLSTGGKKLLDVDDSENIVVFLRGLSDEELPETYVCGSGKIRIDGDEYPCYFVLNHNKSYAKVSGDFKFNTISIPIEEIILENPKNGFVNKLQKFIEKVREKKIFEIREIAVSPSPDGLMDIRENVLYWNLKPYAHLEKFFNTMELEGEEDPRLEKQTKLFKPYKVDYLARKVLSQENYSNYWSDVSNYAKIISVAGSVLLIAEREDSFMRLYEKLKRDFLETLGGLWIDDEKIEKFLKKWVELTDTLNTS